MTERAIGMCLSCHKFLSHSASVSYFLFSVQLFEKVIVLLRQIDLHPSGFPTEQGGRGRVAGGLSPLIPKIWKMLVGIKSLNTKLSNMI